MRIFQTAFACCLGALLYTACMPPESAGNRPKDKIAVDLSDKAVQRLYNFRDERRVDSLRAYLQNSDATLRYLAALSFASWRDTTVIADLVPLLQDPVEDVRIAAAFSLGQTAHAAAENPLVQAFAAGDSLSEHQRFNAIVLEAVGKCGSKKSLHQIATVSTYLPSDTLLLQGQCRAVYRFGLRGILDSAGTALMVKYAADEHIPESARLMAAHYLARAKELVPDSLQAVRMAAAMVRAKSPEVRMALATGLGRSGSAPAFGILSKVIRTETDWRVKCNIINALAKFEYDTVRALVVPLISDPNPHVARTAAEFFVNNGRATDGDYYWRISNDRNNQQLSWPVRVALFRASNRWLSAREKPESRDYIVYRLREMYQQSTDPYERAACLHALSESGWQYRWIHDKGFNDAAPVVKTAAAEALFDILKRPDFYRYFGEGGRGVRRELYVYLREIVASGDPGMIAAAAEGFAVPALDFRTMRDTARSADLAAALAKLKMPRDVEAYMALAKAQAYLDNKPEPAPYRPAFNHPIDWALLQSVSAATRINIQTSQGVITAELYPFWAPGSVANFIQLAQTGFFNGKTIHRVVPNFVIQDGCPRGDGYGALDYTIRTENGLAWYDAAGYLGMASAGTDTEGTQWFITHSPTPHLDGRYTIFGKVQKGYDVLDKIQVGDKVEKITVTN